MIIFFLLQESFPLETIENADPKSVFLVFHHLLERLLKQPSSQSSDEEEETSLFLPFGLPISLALVIAKQKEGASLLAQSLLHSEQDPLALFLHSGMSEEVICMGVRIFKHFCVKDKKKNREFLEEHGVLEKMLNVLLRPDCSTLLLKEVLSSIIYVLKIQLRIEEGTPEYWHHVVTR